MAVGPHRVYLTFAQVPYVVSVAKPRIRSVLPRLALPAGDGQHRCVQSDEGAGASERELSRRHFPGAGIKAEDYPRERTAEK
jgi:hypothetical protein